MSEEPQLPPLPAVGPILTRKDKYIERKFSVMKCSKCNAKYQRKFTVGDYTFKKIQDEEKCEKCGAEHSLQIEEIYSEWYDPKKKAVYINKDDL